MSELSSSPSLGAPPEVTHTNDGTPILFYAEAFYDYSATADEEFDFEEGDIIAVTDTPDNGWWHGELVDEKRRETGRNVFPSNFVAAPPRRAFFFPPLSQPTKTYTDDGWPILFYVEALYDYSATADEEFDFQVGDIIAVTDTPKSGWWHGELVDETRGQAGRHIFPSNYVRLF